jgi:mono/diheme cytochrome c family protein
MRVSVSKLLLLSGVVFGIPTTDLPAQEEEPQQELPEITEALIAKGKRIFIGAPDCVSCHGLNGRGTDRAPRLSDRDWIHGDGSYKMIVDLVVHGVPEKEAKSGKEMPFRGWRKNATDEEIHAVAAYVWSLGNRP